MCILLNECASSLNGTVRLIFLRYTKMNSFISELCFKGNKKIHFDSFIKQNMASY